MKTVKTINGTIRQCPVCGEDSVPSKEEWYCGNGKCRVHYFNKNNQITVYYVGSTEKSRWADALELIVLNAMIKKQPK